MSDDDPFSGDYRSARERFCEAAARLGWSLESHTLPTAGPSGEPLATDVAISSREGRRPALVLSSGLHGVEGLFGSAVQRELLRRWQDTGAPDVRCIFIHAINPHGFAWMRRTDEQNVDLNRNFLLDGEAYSGSPPGYADYNNMLNPPGPPVRWEPFFLKALLAIARYGLPAVKQTVAAGQYDFPHGLFYGGSGPAPAHRLIAAHLPRWLDQARQVVHFDFHTGLGAWGTGKLLIDYPLTDAQHARLVDWYGAQSFETWKATGIAYQARGGLGHWCVAQHPHRDYLFACAEFGTYGPVKVLSGLRTENQCWHAFPPDHPQAGQARRRLQELFCPAAPAWRRRVVAAARALVERAVAGLAVSS